MLGAAKRQALMTAPYKIMSGFMFDACFTPWQGGASVSGIVKAIAIKKEELITKFSCLGANWFRDLRLKHVFVHTSTTAKRTNTPSF